MTSAQTDWQHGADEGSKIGNQLGRRIDENDEVVVIIGSGAGGGTLAYELTARGV